MSYLIRRVLAKPRLILDEMCCLYGKFASYLRRVLCKTRLIFPRINGPSVSHTFSVASKSCGMSHTFLVASKSFGVAVDPVVAVVICHLKPFDITQLFCRFKIT